MIARVKICGIMTPEHGRAAVRAGADYIGLVFAPSRRRVSVDDARVIVQAARNEATDQNTPIAVVGVFVNEQPAVINEIAAALALDYVQFSGYETTAAADVIDRPVIKAIRFDSHASENEWLGQSIDPVPLLIDAHVSGSFGGAGVTADWQRAADLAGERSIWLAGGLTPDNVAEAVHVVRPAVVDVSSGVETNGVKDVTKIIAFIRAAKHSAVVADAVVEQ